MASTATVDVGSKVSVAAKVAPKSSAPSLTYVSSDESVATVNAAGEVTGVKAGEAVITATMKCGTVKKTAKTTVTVKAVVAELSGVTQTASNAFTATFTADASKTFTKEDFKVVAVDGSVELAVGSVDYSADGLSAKVTLFGNFTDAKAYKITCKDKVFDLTAKVGAVTRIAINTASAEMNTETPISFTLFDADGIDVTSSVSVDSTCMVTATGDYTALKNARASAATITMDTVGNKAEVTVIYNSNVAGAEDITAKGTITCIRANLVQGTKLFVASEEINDESKCAKFYLGLSDSLIKINVGSTDVPVFFCAKDANGDVISYDKYEVESSNDDVASASAVLDSGKFAKIALNGNSAGNVSLNIKAYKNGEPVYYTVPVTVGRKSSAVSMTVNVSRPTMSNSNDPDYSGGISVTLYDKDKNVVASNARFELIKNPSANKPQNEQFRVDDTTGKYTAHNAPAGTYTIQVTGADNENETVTFTKNVNVTVSALPENKANLKLTYQIELNETELDENTTPDVFGQTHYQLKSRLYATYNNMFVGYIRSNAGTITIGGDGSGITAAQHPQDVKVAVKFGTNLYNSDTTVVSGAGLCVVAGKSTNYDGYEDLADVGDNSAYKTYSAVNVSSSGLLSCTLDTPSLSYIRQIK